MEISIYGHDGTLKMTVPPGSGSRCITQLQGDSELSLSFDYYEYVALDVNDYVDFLGARYRLLEQYRPKEVSTVHWKYDVRLYGIESLIKRYLVIEHTDGDANPVFTLTAPASQHIRMIAECLNSATGTSAWGVGSVVDTGNITIDYEGKYCDEGLRELAEAAGTEYWFSGRLINLCRCEHGTALQLGYGNGLISLERDVADNAKFYTRLYPVGSSRNINPETYGHKRLQLPNGRKYVDLDVDKYGVIDHYEQDAFSKIYPRYMGTVGSVRVEERTSDEGTVFQVYYIKDNSLPFDPNNYLLPNEKIRVSFQTGDMQGLGETDDHYFEADYNSTTGEYEIMNIWTDGEQLPRAGLAPAVGDQYIPWNISMPDTYIRLAEQEYKAAVDDYNQKHFVDVSVYRGDTDHTWVEANSDEDISVGRRVRLSSSQYFPSTGYRDSRIVKVTRRLDLPSQMELEISDAVSTGTLTKINDALKDIAEDIRTGDSAFYDFLKNRYSTFISAIKNQVDGKAETWISSSDPSLQWNTNDMRDAHVGDMWLNSSSGTVAGVPPMATAIYTKDTTTSPATYSWVVDGSIPNDVFDTIDGKASIYTNDPTDNDPAKRFPTNYQERDLWILGADFTINGIAYKKGTILTASADSVTYNEAHWTELVRYTDDSVANEIITKYGNILGITSPTAENVGEAVGYLSGILNHPAGTTVAGGLVLTSLIAMRGTESTPLVWGGMNGTYLTDESGTSPYRYKGHGIAAWYGGAMVDKECISPAPAESSWNTYKWARSLFRFDGSGYVANGNISWDKDGTPSIKGNVIDTTTLKIGGTTVNLSDYVTLNSAQTITGLKTFNNKIKIGDVYLEWESANNALKVYKMSGSSVAAVNLYATGGVSAFGLSSSGGSSLTLNHPLDSINAINANPSSANQTLVWNGSSWGYASVGSGSVSSVVVNGTSYSPVSGVVTLPNYPTKVSDLTNDSGFITNSALSGYLPLTGGTLTGNLYAPSIVLSVFLYLRRAITTDSTTGVQTSDQRINSYNGAGGETYALRFQSTYDSTTSVYTYTTNFFANLGNIATTTGAVGEQKYNALTLGSTARRSTSCGYAGRINLYMQQNEGNAATVRAGSIVTTHLTANRTYTLPDATGTVALESSNVASATKLQTARTLWGNSFDGTADVSGTMTVDGSVILNQTSSTRNRGIVGTYNSAKAAAIWAMGSSYNIDADGSGLGNLYGLAYAYKNLASVGNLAGGHQIVFANNGTVSVAFGGGGLWSIGINCTGNAAIGGTLVVTGATTLRSTLSVAGGITLGTTKRIYFGDTSHYIELDSTGFHFSHGLYSDSFVSAFGASTTSQQLTLNHPLDSINSINANPSSSGQTLVWNGSSWGYASVGSGSVSSVVVNGTSYSPVSGVVTLPDLLPLTGGTLTSSNNVLNIKSTTANSWIYFDSAIEGTSAHRAAVGYYRRFAFISNESHYGRIGVTDGGIPQYWDNSTGGSGHQFDLIHSGNIGSYLANYLPLTGGTLTGSGADILTINRTLNDYTWIRFYNKNNLVGYLGVNSSSQPCFNSNGTTYTLWHAGNSNLATIDWSCKALTTAGTATVGSTLTAQAIVSSAYLYLRKAISTNATTGVQTSDQRIYAKIGDDTETYGIRFYSQYNPSDSSYSIATYFYDGKGSLIYGRGAVGSQQYQTLTLGATYKRSGNYGVAGRISLYMQQNEGNAATVRAGSIVTTHLTDNRTYTLPDATGTVALESSNVASATKLQTARSIWGQSFDGTADITGTLQLNRVGDVSYGRISYYSSSYYTWYTYMTNAGTASPTTQNTPSGTYVTSWALRNLIENGAGFGWTWESCTNKNTSTPDIKMEVSSNTGNMWLKGHANVATIGSRGTLEAAGATTLSSTLAVTGATTLSSTLSVANAITLSGNTAAKKRIYFGDSSHYIELNSTGFHFSHGLYSDGFVSAFGASSGGSSLNLNGVLSSINSSSLAAPSATGQTVVWDGSTWQYSTTSNVTLKADKIYAANGITISSGSLSLSNGSISLPGYINAYGNIITNSKIAIGYSSVSSSYQFYCKNNGYISGTLTQGSDIRRKNIVGDVDMLDINNVASAPIFRFTWKDRDDPHIYAGTSAQYWQDKLPETVLSTDEGYLSMDYGATALIATILTARKVVEHERRIRDLETENERLRKEINELKAA